MLLTLLLEYIIQELNFNGYLLARFGVICKSLDSYPLITTIHLHQLKLFGFLLFISQRHDFHDAF
jgi:hypothetical protein